jgi:hypothetical protein
MAPSAPGAAFSGWKVTRATVELSAPGAINGDKLIVPADATVRLSMTPDNSDLAAPPVGPGIDSANTSINRPPDADLTFQSGRLVSIGAGAAALQTLGVHVALQRSQAQPEYDSFLMRVCIPFAGDMAALPMLAGQSTLCRISGQGQLVKAAWAPTSSNAAPEQLGDAGSGGALVLVADGTFTASNAGMERGPLRLGQVYILADLGTLGVEAATASNLTADYPLALPVPTHARRQGAYHGGRPVPA